MITTVNFVFDYHVALTNRDSVKLHRFFDSFSTFLGREKNDSPNSHSELCLEKESRQIPVSFRSMITDLSKKGLYLCSVSINKQGNYLFHTSVVPDEEVEDLFRLLTSTIGWITVRQNNPDGSVSFTSSHPSILSENLIDCENYEPQVHL